MNLNNFLTGMFLLLSLMGFSQDEFYYKDYNWKTIPEKFELTSEELQKDQITLSEKKYTHFLYKDNNLVKCILEHKIIQLNNDQAIENNNKFYVSNYGSLEVLHQKARVINPNGKIIELSSKDIQTATDENGNPEYQYFAFEGIEKGSIIEYFHVMSFPPDLTGEEVRVQNSHQKKNIEYEIICPVNLEFKIKSENGLPDFITDTIEQNYNRYYLHSKSMEGVENEPSCSYGANLQKYFYMLFRINSNGTSNVYNYKDVTKNIHSNMFAPLSSKEVKKVNEFIKMSNAEQASNVLEKVRLVENYLKNSIVIQSGRFDGSLEIEEILKNKVTNENGATKLMLNCLRNLGIAFELVLTCDRNESRFIKDFQGYNFLDHYLIYVNELDAYFEADLASRLGFPSFNYVYTEGLFIKEIKIGDLISSIGAVKKINGKKMDDSIDEILTHVTINDDKTTSTIEIERKTTGYKSVYQSIIDYVGETQRNEIKEEFLNYIDHETKPENVVFQNDSSALYGTKPFIGKCVLKSPNFIEQAGDKLLFKIGLLIGPQTNLYNSNERKLPVETEHAKKYNRTITFEIPEGYSIKNLDDLNMSVQPSYDNNAIGFVSKYEVKENSLVVQVDEWYSTVLIPVSDYKVYEDVVNAAADFNKLIIVLQKN